MKQFKRFSIAFIFLTLSINNLHSDTPYFVDFKYILNESKAGKEAQEFLKKKLSSGIQNLKKKEKKIIQQKKIISAEEYKKKVKELREKVSSLQKERNSLLDTVAKQRAKAKKELLKNLNPIMSDYMKENKIRMIVDKKSILLADENLNLTEKIIKILNSKLKSIKLN